MKRPAPEGSTHLVLAPLAFLGRIAALIPPPRVHLTRFHGFFAPAARRRKSVVPAPPPEPSRELPPAGDPLLPTLPVLDVPALPRTRIPWAELLRRVHKVDVLACACGGRMRVIAYLEDPQSGPADPRAPGIARRPAAARARPRPAAAGVVRVTERTRAVGREDRRGPRPPSSIRGLAARPVAPAPPRCYATRMHPPPPNAARRRRHRA